MVRIIVFGPGPDPTLHRQLLDRARAAAARFDDRVVMEEQEPLGELAAQMGLAGSPAIAVDGDVVCVRAAPSMRHLLAVVERHVARTRD